MCRHLADRGQATECLVLADPFLNEMKGTSGYLFGVLIVVVSNENDGAPGPRGSGDATNPCEDSRSTNQKDVADGNKRCHPFDLFLGRVASDIGHSPRSQ